MLRGLPGAGGRARHRLHSRRETPHRQVRDQSVEPGVRGGRHGRPERGPALLEERQGGAGHAARLQNEIKEI
uniref:Uncharacterized protein n=1 Tax=Steinernema glaseri TaxID=37863 RepID=A0A1I7Y2Z3_9BILA